MKKWLLIISATVICVAAAFLYFFSLTPKGDTITSRESILNTAISKGNEWTIAKELELGGYIVSGAYSADNKSTLAIFEPTEMEITNLVHQQTEIVMRLLWWRCNKRRMV